MYWASNTFTLPVQGRDKKREITNSVVENSTMLIEIADESCID